MMLPSLLYGLTLIGGLVYAVHRTVLWAEEDARLRGKEPWVVKCAVIVFFPLGLIAWLLLRPGPIGGTLLNHSNLNPTNSRRH
ncbi:hypothetical protein KKG90_09040 [Candidatus Bipolaricaulota bacterium]|nr:hypothetical protein [Candidatus Bipolaricaulota bacterium]